MKIPNNLKKLGEYSRFWFDNEPVLNYCVEYINNEFLMSGIHLSLPANCRHGSFTIDRLLNLAAHEFLILGAYKVCKCPDEDGTYHFVFLPPESTDSTMLSFLKLDENAFYFRREDKVGGIISPLNKVLIFKDKLMRSMDDHPEYASELQKVNETIVEHFMNKTLIKNEMEVFRNSLAKWVEHANLFESQAITIRFDPIKDEELDEKINRFKKAIKH